MDNAKVDTTYIPRFKIGFEANITKPLKNMGINCAFEERKADFSGTDGKKNWISLGPVVHKACVEVNEAGTVAAAYAAELFKTWGVLEPSEFKADHPFLFLIRDNRTGSILFIGRVMDPTK
jgi:serpin B